MAGSRSQLAELEPLLEEETVAPVAPAARTLPPRVGASADGGAQLFRIVARPLPADDEAEPASLGIASPAGLRDELPDENATLLELAGRSVAMAGALALAELDALESEAGRAEAVDRMRAMTARLAKAERALTESRLRNATLETRSQAMRALLNETRRAGAERDVAARAGLLALRKELAERGKAYIDARDSAQKMAARLAAAEAELASLRALIAPSPIR